MPLIESTYTPPFILRNRHINTIYPFFLRQTNHLMFERITMETPDHDFCHLDMIKQKSSRVLVLVHGLEGSVNSYYIRAMSHTFSQAGFDVVVLNLRGCSGEPNLLPLSYHSGKTDDLDLLIQRLINHYQGIYIAGFSLGGNIVLKFAGELADNIPHQVKAVAGVSVPVHLPTAAYQLKKGSVYLKRLMKSLQRKALLKKEQFPYLHFTQLQIEKTYDFIDFDNLYTAPVHGFKDAMDYYKKSSSLNFMPDISIPSYLLNSRDDPFLSAKCFPEDLAAKHSHLYLEIPDYGGHVGFLSSLNLNKPSWYEVRLLEFFNKY